MADVRRRTDLPSGDICEVDDPDWHENCVPRQVLWFLAICLGLPMFYNNISMTLSPNHWKIVCWLLQQITWPVLKQKNQVQCVNL
jgi:hypothetical protein